MTFLVNRILGMLSYIIIFPIAHEFLLCFHVYCTMQFHKLVVNCKTRIQVYQIGQFLSRVESSSTRLGAINHSSGYVEPLNHSFLTFSLTNESAELARSDLLEMSCSSL